MLSGIVDLKHIEMSSKARQLKEWFFVIEEPPNTSAKNVASRAFYFYQFRGKSRSPGSFPRRWHLCPGF